MIGTVVSGRYEIVKLIGEGGMGAVYEALDGERRVALKVISDEEVAQDDVLVARFEREAEAAAKVRSPHIVEILGTGHDEAPYMVMELLEGENVLEVLERLGPLPPDLAIRIGIQTCRGLEKAHEVGVVHRDIKPANLFLHRAAEDEVMVKLLDFGVAKFKMDQAQASQNQSLTRTGSMLGSPMYMSPEQARGLKSIDHRADLWSLGIVMYQLLTGRQPHEEIEGLGELIITICSEPPEPVTEKAPWCSPRLAQAIQRALMLSTDERYPSAAEFAAALEECLSDGLAADAPIRPDMLQPLSDEQRAAQPKTTSSAPPKDDATVALEDPEHLDDPPKRPEKGKHDISLSDAKTIALDRDQTPTVPEPRELPALRAAPPAARTDAQRAAPPAARTDAQRAALAAAQLPPESSSGTGSRLPVVVVLALLALAAAAIFLYWGT